MLNSVIASLSSMAASAATAAPNALQVKKIHLTTLDWVGAITAIASIGTAIAFMIVMAGWMTYKAFTHHESLTTSWGSPQEESFASFTETSEKIHGKAFMAALVSAGVALAVALGLYFGVSPKKDKTGDTMDLSTFDKKGKAPAPGPSATP